MEPGAGNSSSINEATMESSRRRPVCLPPVELLAWLVTGDLPPGYSGAAGNDLLLARELPAHGIEPLVVSHRQAGESAFGEVHGVAVLRLCRPSGWAGKMLYPIELVYRLASARPRPAILRFRGFGLRRALCIVLCRHLFPGLKIIVQPACSGVDDPGSLAASRWGGFKRRQMLAADGLLAMNRSLEASFAEAGYPGDRVMPVRNPVDPKRFVPIDQAKRLALRRQLRLPADAFVALTVGGLSRRKRQAWITASAAESMASEPRFYLLHLGPAADDLKRLGFSPARVAEARSVATEVARIAAESGIAERVRRIGLRDDAAPFFQVADLFVQASNHEGEANAVNEAMACALPCMIPAHEVYERQVAPSEASAEQTVFRYDNRDQAAFKAVLSEIRASPERVRNAGLAARRRVVAERAPAVAAADYAAILRRVAARATRPIVFCPPPGGRQEFK